VKNYCECNEVIIHRETTNITKKTIGWRVGDVIINYNYNKKLLHRKFKFSELLPWIQAIPVIYYRRFEEASKINNSVTRLPTHNTGILHDSTVVNSTLTRSYNTQDDEKGSIILGNAYCESCLFSNLCLKDHKATIRRDIKVSLEFSLFHPQINHRPQRFYRIHRDVSANGTKKQ
jgi:hypothetical protein